MAAGPPDRAHGDGDPPEWDEHYSKTLLEEFKSLAATQADLAERMADRARQAFLYIGAFFAVAQTAALSTFNATEFQSGERRDVLHWAIAAAVGVCLTGVFSLLTGALLRHRGLGPADVEHAGDDAVRNDDDVALILARRYKEQVTEATEPLKDKRKLLVVTQVLSVLTMVMIVIEIIVALSARTA